MEQVVTLPDAVDFQVRRRMSDALKPHAVQHTLRRMVVGHCLCLNPMKAKLFAGHIEDGSHRDGHKALASEVRIDPIAQDGALKGPAGDSPKIDAAQYLVCRLQNLR